jgi:hypothetical protein
MVGQVFIIILMNRNAIVMISYAQHRLLQFVEIVNRKVESNVIMETKLDALIVLLIKITIVVDILEVTGLVLPILYVVTILSK